MSNGFFTSIGKRCLKCSDSGGERCYRASMFGAVLLTSVRDDEVLDNFFHRETTSERAVAAHPVIIVMELAIPKSTVAIEALFPEAFDPAHDIGVEGVESG